MKFDLTNLPLGEALIGFVLTAVVVTFVLAFAFGPDGGIEEEEAVAELSPTPGAGSSGNGAEGSVVAISMAENFFDANEVTVSAGTTVTFDLTNNGVAIHNMRISGPDGQYNTDDDTLSDPDVVFAGGTASLTWQAPDQPGQVIFRCDFHPIEMIGTITVE